MKIYKSTLKHLIRECILESEASDQAKKQGLKHVGWGKYADNSGKVVAKSVGGKLQKVGQQQKLLHKKTKQPNIQQRPKINIKQVEDDIRKKYTDPNDPDSYISSGDVADYVSKNYKKLTGKNEPKYSKNKDFVYHPSSIYKLADKLGIGSDDFDDAFGDLDPDIGADKEASWREQSAKDQRNREARYNASLT